MKCTLKITVVAIVLIFIMFMSKYKPMYKVTIAGETIGYIANKKEVEKMISEYINTKTTNIAYIDIGSMPNYQLSLVPWNKLDSTQEVLQKVKDNSQIIYKLFAINVGEKQEQYVLSKEEADKVVEDLKQIYDGMVDLSITSKEIYTSNLEDIKSINVELAEANLSNEILEDASSINGIVLSKPITGTISSRYGSRWGRSHTGIDIASVMGTPIYSCSKGTVTFTGEKGGYGNLVIVNHGNGIETYYGHCSKIYAKVGDIVTKDTVIAAVGSTGNSTGPHLHLEIRKNGIAQNPQNYLYN